MSASAILRTKGLTKRFSRRRAFRCQETVAVEHLDLEVFPGEIFGFLGPNGAGKTTTLNMILGLVEPSEGVVELFGARFRSGDTAALRCIGYVPESASLPEYFTVHELLDFYAQLFEVPRRAKDDRISLILEAVGLSQEKNAVISSLSMGQRRLVDFAQALINDPDLILLDEPTVYLDPLVLERFRAIFRGLRSQGKTILMSSHMLSEIEKLSDRVAIIDRGRLLKVGAKDDFTRQGSMEEEFLRLIKDAQR